MNFLRREIGIWYKDKLWARTIYSELINQIPTEIITMEMRSMNSPTIALKDGTYIRWVPVAKSSRGCSFNEIYIQEGTDIDSYETIIRPTCKIGSCESIYIVENPEDFFHRRSAQQYYFEEELRTGRITMYEGIPIYNYSNLSVIEKNGEYNGTSSAC